MALAARGGLHDLASYVRPPGDCGANAELRAGCRQRVVLDWPTGWRVGGRMRARAGYSFLATSGPVMRASSGKVAAMMPRDTRIPPAVRR